MREFTAGGLHKKDLLRTFLLMGAGEMGRELKASEANLISPNVVQYFVPLFTM
jgi:hypothetical protein